MKKGIFHVLAAAAVIFGIQGCGTLQAPMQPVRFYTLSYPAPKAPKNATPLPGILKIEPLRAAEPYGSNRIVYAENEYSRSTYVYHQWISKPADMVGGLLLRDLRASQIIETLVGPQGALQPTHTLRATVESFYEDDAGKKWEAVLAIDVILAGTGGPSTPRPVLLHKTYRCRKPLEQNNPLGLARAMSKALAEVSSRLIDDLRHALGR